MAIDKVICPHCGAENMASPIITMCSSCLGSLKDAEPAAESTSPSVSESAPPAQPPVEEPPAPPESAPPQPAPSAEMGPTVSDPLYAELPSPSRPADFRPPRSEVPPLEVPTIPSGPSVSEPIRELVPEAEASAFRPLKVICPNCRAANPPDLSRCNRCNARLPTVEADGRRGSDWAQQWGAQPDSARRSTSGHIRWGAACGCLLGGSSSSFWSS